jgi:cysteinyl-tRNA synthetase
MSMKIYDTRQKSKQPLHPIREGEVSLYVCGPTVYDDAHLGHARSALSFDLLVRTLRAAGYRVKYVRNFTDVDDKIIHKIEETGKSLEELTGHYIGRYLAEMEALHILRPDVEPKATESIRAMEQMIARLISQGYAYRVPNGDVYFDTSKDQKYGSLSGQVADEQTAQSRIATVSQKRNSRDFALWKACGPKDEICFDSAWSQGRPGWHIECSAMIEQHFEGDHEYLIDIHGGGADLLFPHHENEAAQSRCATGRELAKHWMHNGFVQVDGEKMSKSLGNSFFLKDALAVYDGEVLRYYLGSVHYRNDFNFNEIDLIAAKKRLDKLYRLKKRIVPAKATNPSATFRDALLEAMTDDLNISMALAIIDEMVTDVNERLDQESKSKPLKQEILANIKWIENLLGFGSMDPCRYFQIRVDWGQSARHGLRPVSSHVAKQNNPKTTLLPTQSEMNFNQPVLRSWIRPREPSGKR